MGLRKPPELGRDLAKSRHDQASPCPERLEKVIGVRVCAEEVSNIHQVPPRMSAGATRRPPIYLFRREKDRGALVEGAHPLAHTRTAIPSADVRAVEGVVRCRPPPNGLGPSLEALRVA